MKISQVKKFYVENTRTDKEQEFCSLTQAIEYVIEQANTDLLIHIGGYNLSYYLCGDTFDKLYTRCANILATI